MIKQIENYINENLTGDFCNTALEFAAFLRANKMQFVKDNGYWKNKIYYLVKYRNEYVCFITIKDPDEKDNLWTVWSDDSKSDWYEIYPVEENLKEIAWKYADFCGNCGSCSGGKRKTIFGKEFDNVCSTTFRFDNPDAEALRFIKRMVEIRKDDILKKK